MIAVAMAHEAIAASQSRAAAAVAKRADKVAAVNEIVHAADLAEAMAEKATAEKAAAAEKVIAARKPSGGMWRGNRNWHAVG